MNTSNKYIAYMLDNKILYKLSIFLLFVIIAMILFGIDPVAAGTAGTSEGSSAAPWETPLTSLAKSLTGPVASAIALISMVVCGGLLVFGGELGDFARRMVMVVLAVSVMTTGAKVLSFLGVESALIL